MKSLRDERPRDLQIVWAVIRRGRVEVAVSALYSASRPPYGEWYPEPINLARGVEAYPGDLWRPLEVHREDEIDVG